MTATPSEIRSAGFPEIESQLVDRLAHARAALHNTAEAWQERLRWQRANAEELFARRQRDIFQADLRAWRADPFANNALFGKTALSAAWLKGFWEGVKNGLSSPFGITYDQAKNMVTSAGGDWRADRIDVARGCMMGMFLALCPQPEAALTHWVADSLGLIARRGWKCARSAESVRTKSFETANGAVEFETVMARARLFLTTAPKPEQARATLYAIAAEESNVWPGRLERLQGIEDHERTRCAEGFSNQDLGSAADIRETRRLRRELARAERLVDQLERRLSALRRRSVAKPARNQAKAGVTVVHGAQELQSSTNEPHCSTPFDERTTAQFEIEDSAKMQSVDSASANSNPDPEPASGSSAVPVRKARRPDPRVVAKAWRAKSKPGFRNAGSKVAGRTEMQAATRG